MTSLPRAFFALDFGSATTSGAVVGHLGGRWRLVAHSAAPSYVDVDTLLVGLLTRIGQADPEMLDQLSAGETHDIPAMVADWPRLEARTTPQRRIAVLAGSRRQRRRLEMAALRAGWLVVGGSADEDDAVALMRIVLSTETSAVLLGADNSPGGDEKRHLPELATMVAAATRSRPELTVVLAGGAAVYESEFMALIESTPVSESAIGSGGAELDAPDAGPVEPPAEKAPPQTKRVSKRAEAALEGDAQEAAVRDAAAQDAAPEATTTDAVAATSDRDDANKTDSGIAGTVPLVEAAPSATVTAAAQRPAPMAFQAGTGPMASTHVLLAPDAEAGQPPGASLQQVLEGLRAVPNDGRLGVAGFGAHEPVASNVSTNDRQKNRRVEIFVMAPETPVVGWTDTMPKLY